MKQGEYALEFVNGTYRAAPALWEVLSTAGKRVCVLGVPGTYPPQAVNGVIVSGFDSPVCTSVDTSFVYPKSEFDSVKDWRFADFQESKIGPGWHGMALAKLLDGVAAKERIAVDFLRREPWDFFMVVFGESDTVSHHFWMFHDPESPRHRPGHADAIQKVYERLDAAVGTLVYEAGENVVVGVVSDHGFGGAGTGIVHLNNWLAETGYLRLDSTGDSVAKKTAMRFTSASWRGAIFRRLKPLAVRAESHSRFGGIDWTATRAWSEELNYFPSVRVNLKGREPSGQVEPADYESFCRDLCARLEAWEPVRKAWRREELYAGAHVERAPDIVLELALDDGYSYSCLRSRGGAPLRQAEAYEYLGGKERGMNGNHRPTGVFFLSEATSRERMSLLDVAPTVYSALNVAAPPVEGASLLDGAARRDGEALSSTPEPYTPEQEAVVAERLRGLGYFE
jgi:predicted AlkP superfamily phosphohydrolase/phosphomutase